MLFRSATKKQKRKAMQSNISRHLRHTSKRVSRQKSKQSARDHQPAGHRRQEKKRKHQSGALPTTKKQKRKGKAKQRNTSIAKQSVSSDTSNGPSEGLSQVGGDIWHPKKRKDRSASLPPEYPHRLQEAGIQHWIEYMYATDLHFFYQSQILKNRIADQFRGHPQRQRLI